MESILPFIGLAAAALLVVAVSVAWWEQARATRLRCAPPAPASATSLDVNLDRLAELSPPGGDQATRDAVLGSAMARMAKPTPSSVAWLETQPMVAPGRRTQTAPSAGS